MEISIDAEDGKIYLALREIGGASVTVQLSARGSNTLGACLCQAANALDEFTGSEMSLRGELEVKTP